MSKKKSNKIKKISRTLVHRAKFVGNVEMEKSQTINISANEKENKTNDREKNQTIIKLKYEFKSDSSCVYICGCLCAMPSSRMCSVQSYTRFPFCVDGFFFQFYTIKEK